MPDRFNKQGTTLLLAMLIMAGVLTVSLATSKLIINEVVQSAQLDRAVVAFYAAEGGIEKSLYKIRKQDVKASDMHLDSASLSNNSSYQLIAEDTEDILYATISEDDTYQIDLFEPGSLTVLANPIKAVRLNWQGVGSWLEVKWSSWTTGGVIQDHQAAYISQASSPYIIQLYDSGSYLYRLRITARNVDASSVEITAYSNISSIVNFF